MKNIMSKRLPAAVLALLLLLSSLLSGCGGGGAAVSTSQDAAVSSAPEEVPDEPAERVLYENGEFLFSFVRTSDASDEAVDRISAVYKSVRDLGEGKLSYTDDYLYHGAQPDPDLPEILIGPTNRPETAEVLADLLAKDWFVGFVGKKLVVTGHTEQATLEALSAFSDIVKQMKKSDRVLFAGLDEPIVKRCVYPGQSATVAGNPLDGYRIVVSMQKDEGAADAGAWLAAGTGESTGRIPEVVKTDDGPGRAIYVGSVSERGKELAAALTGSEWSLRVEGGNIYINGNNSWAVKAACVKLLGDYFDRGADIPEGTALKGESMGIQISERTPGSNLRLMTNNVWNCDNNKEAWIAIGENCSAEVRSVGFARVYTAYMPDVINTQEMTAKMLSSILYNMEKFGVKYSSLAINDPVADFTALIYNPETVTLEKSGHHVFGYASDASSKGYTWGYFRHNATGAHFISLSTHLWWKSESAQEGSNANRERQAAEIVALTKELEATYGCPVFIQGDLNTQTTSKAFAVLTDGGFLNCQKIATVSTDDKRGYHSCSPSGFSLTLSSGTYTANGIDHMLVRGLGTSKVLTFEHILPDFYYTLSDHFPVYIDVELN